MLYSNHLEFGLGLAAHSDFAAPSCKPIICQRNTQELHPSTSAKSIARAIINLQLSISIACIEACRTQTACCKPRQLIAAVSSATSSMHQRDVRLIVGHLDGCDWSNVPFVAQRVTHLS